jgi:hypothetical protein
MNLEQLQHIATQMMESDMVELDGKKIPVRRTSAHRLRTVSFATEGRNYTAIEQNSEKPSRWGQLARAGHKVVQFKDDETNRFIAVVVDGKVKLYG